MLSTCTEMAGGGNPARRIDTSRGADGSEAGGLDHATMPSVTPWLALRLYTLSGELPSDIVSLLARARDGVDAAITTAPGLVFALALALVIPLFAVIGGIVVISVRVAQRVAKRADRRRRLSAAANGRTASAAAATGAALLADAHLRLDLEGAKTLTVIGRDGACDVRLDHASVANHHAAIERTTDDELWLHDLTGPKGSGVRVNDRRIACHRLEGGDRIVIGALTLSVKPQTVERLVRPPVE